MYERSEKWRAEREAKAERKKANDAEDKAEEERAGEDAGAAGSAELARVEGVRADEDERAEMIGHAKKATVDMTGSHWDMQDDRRYRDRSDESQRRRDKDVERPRERTRSRTTKAEKRAR